MAVVLVVLVSLIVGVSWLANYAPLTVDNKAFSVRPLDVILDEFDATSPDGDNFTEYHPALRRGEPFSFYFWIHNDGPLPVILTGVSVPLAGIRTGEGVTLEPVAPGDGHPTRTLPYAIPAHGYAQINMSGPATFVGCLDAHTSTSFGAIPITYELFGFFPRHGEVEMPMTISISGPPGTDCAAA